MMSDPSIISRAIASSVVAAMTLGLAAHDDRDRFTVELRTPRTEYLVGEPIVLDVAVKCDAPVTVEHGSTPSVYVRVYLGHKGEEPRLVDPYGVVKKTEAAPLPLGPDQPWTYQRRVLTEYVHSSDGRSVAPEPVLVVTEPGSYSLKASLPLIGVVAVAGRPVPLGGFGYLESKPIQVQVKAPHGDDVRVFEAIRDANTLHFLREGRLRDQDRVTLPKVARLLKEHPKSGYSEALRWPLEQCWSRYMKGMHTDDPEREEVRRLLGKPDDRFFPDDPRLDARVTLDLPKGTPYRQQLAAISKQSGVPITASPFYIRDSATGGGSLMVMTLRRWLTLAAQEKWGNAACARRGQGYYLYCETFYASPAVRKSYRELLGPLEVIFPEDKRLDVQVTANLPETGTIDRAVASYAKQSGVPLSASPFFRRCKQSGERMDVTLREEMAYLARTFRAKWERRGDGYALTVEPEADQ